MKLALNIQGLSKTYRNGFEALKGIDLAIAEGEFFALLGPNGAGKSTTIGIVTSLVTKTAGKVEILDYDLDIAPEKAKSMLGVVPQEINLNIFENPVQILVNQASYYGLPRRLARLRSEHLLKEFDLWSKRTVQARMLSGGMKRRLMIARALIHEPKVLILDEPTAGVDVEIRQSMWESLSKLNAQGTTILLTTHYLEEAENLCRRIAIIDKGCIVENTSMRELLAKLESETIVLDLEEGIVQCPDLAHFDCRKLDEKTLEVRFTRAQNLNQLFAELSKQGIVVKSLRNKSNRLERYFIDLMNKQGVRK